ncbi:MAG: hypothetical protein AAF533_22170 [Acidobacteriota bacterium]
MGALASLVGRVLAGALAFPLMLLVGVGVCLLVDALRSVWRRLTGRSRSADEEEQLSLPEAGRWVLALSLVWFAFVPAILLTLFVAHEVLGVSTPWAEVLSGLAGLVSLYLALKLSDALSTKSARRDE